MTGPVARKGLIIVFQNLRFDDEYEMDLGIFGWRVDALSLAHRVRVGLRIDENFAAQREF